MKFLGLLSKDLKIAWRNLIFVIEIIIAVIMVLLYHLVLPDSFDLSPTLYITGDSAVVAELARSEPDITPVDSREALEAALRDNPSSYGVVAGVEDGVTVIELVFHGYESEQVRNTALLEVEAMDPAWQVTAHTQVRYVYGEPRSQKLPFKVTMLAALLLMEPALLGLFFAATLVFSEKEEGSARAYSVTPGGVWRYLLSKVVVIIILSVLSASLMTGLTVPGSVRWGWMLAVVIAGSIMGSAVALLMASFFDRLGSAMMPLVIVIVILTLPMVTLFAPSVSPDWMRLFPTWHQMFALRECFYDTGRTGIFGWGVGYPLALGSVALLLAGLNFTRRIKD